MSKSYTKQAQNVLDFAAETAKDMGQGALSSGFILAGLLLEKDGMACRILQDLSVSRDDVLRLIDELAIPDRRSIGSERGMLTPESRKILDDAENAADRMGSDAVGTEHLLLAIAANRNSSACRILAGLGAEPGKINAEVLEASGYMDRLSADEKKAVKSGKKLDVTHTPILDQYSVDLTKKAADKEMDPFCGREKEMVRVIQILSRRGKNNPCLIGEPGVGKTAVVEGLAQRISSGMVPENLQNKRILTLDISAMVAGSKYRGEFEERIKGALKEAENNGNILLFIDEIHTIIGAGGAEGAIDASNIMKPALSRGKIQLIGATTIDEYRRYIEKDAALERRFQPVMIEEPSVDQTIEILSGLRSRYEKHHGVVISDEGIRAAAELSDRYINDRFLPDKAIDLMDEAASKVHLRGFRMPDRLKELENEIDACGRQEEDEILNGDIEAASQTLLQKKHLKAEHKHLMEQFQKRMSHRQLTVGENEVASVVAEWTGIPVQRLTEGEAARLKNMEKLLHRRVIAQDEAVTAVSKAVRRGRVGLKDPGRPIGSFLFLGPTGVGKTEISKALAEAVFGTEDAMIRVDMSEYMEKYSVSKMIGSPPGYVGYEEGGQLSEQVRRHPYSVVLFDEIEKAHPDVFNILLQVLDDGHITDAQGHKVDFKNTIIIMTSNAGAQSIIEPKKLGFSSGEDKDADYKRMREQVMEEVRRIFKPEFLNRIDETIVFHALTRNDMKKIVTLMTRTLQKRCEEQLKISLNIRDSAKKYIVDQSFDVKYGARPLRRMIQTSLEDTLAEDILAGSIKEGDTVDVGTKKGKLVFYVEGIPVGQ